MRITRSKRVQSSRKRNADAPSALREPASKTRRLGNGGKERVSPKNAQAPTQTGVQYSLQNTLSPVLGNPSVIIFFFFHVSRSFFVAEEKVDLKAPTRAAYQAFHLSVVPTALKCRSQEMTTITSFIDTAVTSRQGDSLYLCGAPGTGKSLTLDWILRKLQDRTEGRVRVATLNAMTLAKPDRLYPRLLELVAPSHRLNRGPAASAFAAADALQTMFIGPNRDDEMTYARE